MIASQLQKNVSPVAFNLSPLAPTAAFNLSQNLLCLQAGASMIASRYTYDALYNQ